MTERGDVARMSYPNGPTVDVVVLEIDGDKAIVYDKRKPGMRIAVGLEHLKPKEEKRWRLDQDRNRARKASSG